MSSFTAIDALQIVHTEGLYAQAVRTGKYFKVDCILS